MVYGDGSLNFLIRDIQLENLLTMAFKYQTREGGAVHGGTIFIEYRGANVTIVEVCL